MDKTLRTIDAKLGNLRQELTQAEGVVQREQTRINRISAKVEALNELRAELLNGAPGKTAGGKRRVSQSVQPDSADRLRPSQAIVVLLSKTPGLTTLEVIDALEHTVASTAKNIRHNIRTTLFNLVKRGTLVRDGEKRYHLVERDDKNPDHP